MSAPGIEPVGPGPVGPGPGIGPVGIVATGVGVDLDRSTVLEEQPLCRRFPALLEAACLERLAPGDRDDPKGGGPPAPRRPS